MPDEIAKAWIRACRPFDKELVEAASHFWRFDRPLCEYVCGGMYRVGYTRVRGMHAAANLIRSEFPRAVRLYAGNDNLLALPSGKHEPSLGQTVFPSNYLSHWAGMD